MAFNARAGTVQCWSPRGLHSSEGPSYHVVSGTSIADIRHAAMLWKCIDNEVCATAVLGGYLIPVLESVVKLPASRHSPLP